MFPPEKIHDLVEQDKLNLLMRIPFCGRIIGSVDFVIVRDSRVRMACTDYRRIFISAENYPKLSEDYRLAVLAHEVLHIALRHAFRRGHRDKTLFEKAADIEIFFLFYDLEFFDPYGINFNFFVIVKGMTAEQIYDILSCCKENSKTPAWSQHCSPSDILPDKKQSDNKTSESSDNQQKNEQFDVNEKRKNKTLESSDNQQKNEHSDVNEKRKNKPQKEQTTETVSTISSVSMHCKIDSKGDQLKNGLLSVNLPGGVQTDCGNEKTDRMDGTGTDDNGEKPDDSGNPEGGFSDFCPEFDEETEMDCNALSSDVFIDMKKAGEGVFSFFSQLVEKIDKSRVKWLVVLRQFLHTYRGGSYSWTHPNRRYLAQGLYLPGRFGLKCFKGIVALDTSPSTEKYLHRFVSELFGIMQAFGKYDMTIIECASVIRQIWNASSNAPLPDLKHHRFKGCAGTSFVPVFEYIHDHHLNPNVLIFFTDGKGIYPETKPPYPVLWILIKDGHISVPWGHVIYFEED